mgnify:CR=1 FL=1
MSDKSDPYANGQYVEGFTRSANQQTAENERKLPSGEKIYEAGFTTESSLQHEATRPLEVLRPEPTPDDPEGWDTARRKALEQRLQETSNKYWEFKDRFIAARQDFNEKSKGKDR